MNKVFVGNLSFDTTREELEGLFAPLGELTDVFVPLDRSSGRPRGFAFVTFASKDHAAEAVAKLDGVELRGRNLRVNPAEASRPAGGGRTRPGLPRRRAPRGLGAPEGQPPQHPRTQAQHLVAPASDAAPGGLAAAA